MTKQYIRIIYWVVFLFVMVFFILPLFYFFYLFDEHNIRDIIENQFNSQNYKLIINGNILPTFSNGLNISINNIQFIDKNKVNNTIDIKNLNCHISWLYLIFAQYKVTGIDINNVNIKQNDLSKFSLQNIIQYQQQSELNLNKLEFIQINNLNLVNNKRIVLNNANLKLKHNMNNYDFVLIGNLLTTLSFKMRTQIYIENNNLYFDNADINISNKQFKTEFNSNISLNLDNNNISLNNLQGTLSHDTYKFDFNIANSLLRDNKLYFNNSSILINNSSDIKPEHLLLNIDIINLNLLNLSFIINSIVGQYNIDIGGHKNLLNFHIQNLIGESGNIVSQCNIQSNTIFNNMLSTSINSSLVGECNYSKQKFIANLMGNINNSYSTLNLVYHNNLDKRIYINLEMEEFRLSLQKYIKNNLQTILQNYFDKFILQEYNIKAKIKTLFYNDIIFYNVNTNATLNKNMINIEQLNYSLFGANISSSIKVNYHKKLFDIFFYQNISNLNLESAFTNLLHTKSITGIANIKSYLTFNSTNLESVFNNMNGYIELNAKNLILKNTDFLNSSINSFLPIGYKYNNFNNLNASIGIQHGISHDGKIQFNSKNLYAYGYGGVNFILESLDYKLQLQSTLPKNNKNLIKLSIPIYLYGNIFTPKLKIESIELLKVKHLKYKYTK